MNLFNKRVRKASEQLTIPSMPSIRIKKDKDLKCSYCKGELNKNSSYYYEQQGSHFYHIKCLTCHKCKLDCSKEFYHTSKKINKHYLPVIYCKKDMFDVCVTCGESIESGGQVTFLGAKYHSDHFVCSVCDCNLSEHSQAFEMRRSLYCARDFLAVYKAERERGIAGHANRHTPRIADLEFEGGDPPNDPAVERFAPDNLDIRDFSSTDYITVYCGGCNSMLLAGGNIKDIRFLDSGTQEYWHLECFALLKRYRVVLSPKFVNPRRYIMFNKNSRSINLTADLRHISGCLDFYFNRLDKVLQQLVRVTTQKDKSLISRGFNQTIALIQVLFDALDVVQFAVKDYYSVIREFKYTESSSDSSSNLEEMNFLRFQTLKNHHLELCGLFEDLLKQDFTDLDVSDFSTELSRQVDYILGFILHKVLIYNYITKENYLLRMFLEKITVNTSKIDNLDEIVSPIDTVTGSSLSLAVSTKSEAPEEDTDKSVELSARTSTESSDSKDVETELSSVRLSEEEVVENSGCSKCGLEIKLESYISQVYNDISGIPKVFKFHMTCVAPAALQGGRNVVKIVDAYGDGEEANDYSDVIETVEVSVYDQIVESLQNVVKKWSTNEIVV